MTEKSKTEAERSVYWDGTLWGVLLLMFVLQLFAFRLFIFDTGFYNDDWVILERFSRADGFWGTLKAFAGFQHVWTRPVEIPLYPLIYTLTGGTARPALGQFLLMGFDALESVLFLLLMLRLTGSRRFAFAAALFMSLYPNRAIQHVWLTLTPQLLSHVLVLISFLLHLSGGEGRRLGRRIAAQLCYVLAVLCYESTILMPLMLFPVVLFDPRAKRSRRSAFWAAVKDLAPYGVSFFFAAGWQQWGAAALLGWENPKVGTFTFTHLFKAFGAGFECVTNRVIHISVLALRPALKVFGVSYWFFWALLVCAAGAVVYRADGLSASPPVRARRTGALIAAAFVGAYAPYALSGNYMPQIFGIMSRTNGTGAWVGGMLLAWAFDGLMRSRGRRTFRVFRSVLAAGIVGAFLWTDGHAMWEYSQSWKMQRDILRKVSPHAAALPEHSTILLDGAPRHIGHAVVFDATYDFDYALHIAIGRKNVGGKLMSSNARYEPDGIVISDHGIEMKFSYENLYLFDYPSGSFRRVTAPGL